MTTSEEVVEAISGFSSRNVGPEALRFAQEVVQQAAPRSKARAKSLLFAASRLGAFGLSVGLEICPEVLLSPSVIERFCTGRESGLTHATRRTVRSNLRYVAGKVLAPSAGPAALARERAKAPYSDSEIDSYLSLCDAQPTLARRLHAGALICLGAGAGLTGQDLRSVRGIDVVDRSGGVLVLVHGRNSRVVPVLARFHKRLKEAACFAEGAYIIGGSEASRQNVTTPLVSSLAGGAHLGRLDIGRLRATWLTWCAKEIGLRAFMDAAGIVCSQRLGDIVSHLDGVDEHRAVELLGARR